MRPGAVLDDRFEVGPRVATGGSAAVHRGRDRTTGADVAIKVLLQADDAARARFAQEAEVLSRLAHPSIAAYVARGTADDGHPYLVMRWAAGETLAERIGREGKLAPPAAAALGIGVLDALAAMHAAGVVHRDVKPSNIVVGDDGHVTIVDLGIAKAAGEDMFAEPGLVVGTLGYLAPEQAREAGSVDARADVFSVGCVLFVALTGAPPFRADTALAMLTKLLFDEAPRARERAPDVPPLLDAIVARMMGKDPERRYASASDARDALERARSSARGLTEPVLSHREARLFSILLAQVPGPDLGGARRAELSLVARRFGGTPEALANGALAVRWSDGDAKEQAMLAARCALALRSRLGGAPASIATAYGRAAGEAIDGAARLVGEASSSSASSVATCAASEPGPVIVDEATAALVKGTFAVRPSGSGLELLAARDPEALAGAMPLVDGFVPCVGRDDTLARLDAAFASVAAGGAAGVLVVGEAGVGKTRLAREWLERHSAGASFWAGRAERLASRSPFDLFGRMLRAAAGIHEDDRAAPRREKLSAHVAALVQDAARSDEVAAFLGEISGVPFDPARCPPIETARLDPRVMRERVEDAFKAYIRGRAAARPLVIVVDDAHSADPSSARLFARALAAQGGRVFMLAAGRAEARPQWPTLEALELGPLAAGDATALVRGALGASADSGLVDRIVRASSGNALVLEELVRAAAHAEETLPTSVRAVLEARLASLPATTRRALRAASVYGETSWTGAVAALAGPDAGEALSDAAERGLVVRCDGGRFAREAEWSFASAAVRDAAYGMLTVEDRRAAHLVAAAWLEAIGEPNAAVLARHCELGDDGARAAVWYARAARARLLEGGLEDVLALALAGLAARPDDATRAELLATRARIEHVQGAARAACDTAREVLALALPGTRAWAEALGTAAAAGMRIGADIAPLFSLGCAAAKDGAMSAELARALASIGSALALRGRPGDARDALAILDASGIAARDAWVRQRCHHLHGFLADISGEPERVAIEFDASLALAEQLGDGRAAVFARLNAGYGRLLLGAWEEAEQWLERALAEAGRAPLVVAYVKCNLAHALWRLGRRDEAARAAEDATAVFDHEDDRRFAGAARMWRAEIARAGGARTRALELGRRAVALLDGSRGLGAQAKARLALALLDGDGADEALALARDAKVVLDADGPGLETGGEMVVRFAYARALDATGAHDEARAAIASARARLDEVARGIRRSSWREQFLTRPEENVAIAAWAARAVYNRAP